jgi:RsiW-degrading membrane proteinase PrsW (M82 family)
MTITAGNRFLFDSPLGNPRVARLVAIVLAILAEASVIVLVKFQLMSLAPTALGVFLRALLVSGLLSIVPFAALWFLDRRERESIWLYIVMFLWGTLIASGIASPVVGWIFPKATNLAFVHSDILNQVAQNSGPTFAAMLLTPAVEEIVKGMGVFVAFLLLKSEFDGVRDGFIYGALIGIGYNLIDSSFYLAEAYARTGVIPWWQYFVTHHSLLGFGGHALYTGLFGMGLGLARQTPLPWLRIAAPVTGWIAGYAAHITGTLMGLLTIFLAVSVVGKGLASPFSPGSPLFPNPSFWALLISGGYISFFWSFPFVALAGLMLWRSGEWERQVIRDELVDEVEPVITLQEYQAVLADRMLHTRRIEGISKALSASIVNAQNELAIRKWRLSHHGKDPAADPLVASWREEITRLRACT